MAVIEPMTDFGLNLTDTINQVIGTHKRVSEIQRAGGILLARTTDRLEPIVVPEIRVLGTEDLRNINARILPKFREYLEPRTNEHDLDDLVGFWKSAVEVYSDIVERRALEHEFIALSHDIEQYHYAIHIGPLAN